MKNLLPKRFERGYIILLALVFAGIFATVGTALTGSLFAYGRAERITVASAEALALAEGALDGAVSKLNQDPSYGGETNTPLGNGMFTVTVATIDTKTKRVTATGYVPDSQNPTAIKSIKANIGINDSVISFHYGIQSGNGGFFMDNSSSVIGNVFSGGSVIGTSQNYIYGDVISSGSTGLVYGIHATSSVYAHTIGNASEHTIIDKNAYYYSATTNTTVSGTSYSNSPDQATTSLPISDEQIEEWKSEAAAGDTAVCSSGAYTIDSGSVDLGPIKIPCDLDIKNSAVVTIHGHLWVAGDIIVQNSATVKMASALGAQNVALIADNPSDQLTSSKIFVKNTATFQDSGTPGSFVFLISQNRSAEMGGDEEAFSLSNSASALIAYAAHGLIPLENKVSLKAVTAYKIRLKNSARVTYDSGLPNAVFQSGPGGSWSFVPGTYSITR
ncbi:hypothetical protein A3J11_01260 [Candidatus Kaiserbacteria bacterium RIFCSPLOWO2_02_FULL_55_12]|uniref:Uncharacterized protein n=1 Tax=Candidatus Kaiserbacteria bacterium RIFCSPLOWO2_02_FULL_55_12 TaxID=1798522 RepID=A0A1F6F027_9BACT|nr:MAG: hypothetical protein A3J11_01260 [Candidatus Kaiserbacteria bacterium RIFCSPLOWO2_02_FULL_55_12]